MTTYIQRQVQLQVSEEQGGRGQLIKRGDGMVRFDALAALKEAEFKRYDLTAPITNKDLLEGTAITAGKILYLETNGAITVRLGTTGDTAIPIAPLDSAISSKKAVFYYEGSFTHVYVSVAGTAIVEVIMGVVGA